MFRLVLACPFPIQPQDFRGKLGTKGYYSHHMDNGYRTGRDVVSGRLYHYERFCPEWLEGTLRNKQIHCSDPAKLNDPWDCRVWFDCTRMLRDPLEREKMLSLHRRFLPAETLNHPLRPIYEDRISQQR
jgi:hypothetical protein